MKYCHPYFVKHYQNVIMILRSSTTSLYFGRVSSEYSNNDVLCQLLNNSQVTTLLYLTTMKLKLECDLQKG